ncbi:MAG TPA: hydantoinase B/oxoprolinase family protein [Solirubrobacterales bacterium]|jgi:N-methylhydantoinase B|nr:hydantoinase B/oxoprolinase family protein [Solirubrobacterales bacterium]
MATATTSPSAATDYDPVDLEIFTHELESITTEMGLIMIRTSGDPVIAEARDFSTVLTDADGDLLSFGYLTWHLGPARQSIRYLLDNVAPEEINPGDAFLCNDPHATGACHQPDLGVVRPIFAGEELIAWAWAEAHLLDIGGMSPGGFAIDAFECYGEGLRLPGVKFIDRGRPRDDVRRMLTANLRLPVRVLNEIRSFVAACNVCDERIQTILGSLGADGFRRHVEAMKALPEAATRRRIASLRDGVYHRSNWVEHNGHRNDLYKVDCVATVDGDRLTLDFSGSDPQTDGFVNLSLGGTIGCAITPLMFSLVPDIPFNEGVLNAVEFVVPPGTIVNVTMPAPSSAGHMEAGNRVSKVVTALMADMQAASEDDFVRSHAMAPFQDSWSGNVFYAAPEDGEPIPFLDMNGGGSGGGAQSVADGLDCASTMAALEGGLPDVEINELEYPVLYLWRRINRNSGGAGRHRGGQGHEFAWTPWHTEGGSEQVFTACWQVPPVGVLGGYPGGTSGFYLLHGSDVGARFAAGEVPASVAALRGEGSELGVKQGGLEVAAGDVFVQTHGGGGGFGDPLDRPAADVARDVADGYISARHAEAAYAVVLDRSGQLDAGATEELRRARLEERRSWGRPAGGEPRTVDRGAGSRPVYGAVVAVPGTDGETFACERCATDLGPAEGDFRERACRRETEIAARLEHLDVFCKQRPESPHVHLVEAACPGCGTMLAVDVRVLEDLAA